MTPPRVVVTHWIPPEILEDLASAAQVDANRTRDTLPRLEILHRAQEAKAILAFMPDRIDADFLDQCPALGIVAGAFKGVDNVDVDACTARGIWVTAVPDLLTEPTAELAVGLLLSLIRRIPEGDDYVRSGSFRGWRPVLQGRTLTGSTVGLVGMGAVGRAIAARLGGFSCRMIYHDPVTLTPDREKDLRVERAGQEDLLRRSDHVVLAVPLTPHSRHFINRAALGGMKRGASLVNVGRGSVVDEEAVAAALFDGSLGGYATDVFAMEDLSRPDRSRGIPPELFTPHLRTVFTPHLGSAVEEIRREISRSAAESILQFLRGEPPARAVNRPIPSLEPGRRPAG